MKDYTLKAKQEIVSGVQEEFQNAQSMLFLDYRGLTVAEVTDLRNKIRDAGASYKVIKNTVIKRAAENLGIEGLDEILEGPTAVAYSDKDPVSAAKVVYDFTKNLGKTEIKGGVYEGKAIDKNTVINLAQTPSREESIARIMGSLNATVSNFVRALDEIRKQKEEQETA